MIGNLAQFWRLTRELDLNGIRADFERDVQVGVLGTDRESAERVARLIAPDAVGTDLRVGLLSDWDLLTRERRDRRLALFVVVLGGPLEASARRALSEMTVSEVPLLVVHLGTEQNVVVVGVPDDRIVSLPNGTVGEDERSLLVNSLVRVAPEAMLPLGRRHASVRGSVAQHLIRDASRANAQFAAISSLPSSIPILGGLVGDAADLIVLTKNQLVLVFKLAGLYGRDLSLGRQLLAEVVPVVGSAFLWRTTARSIVGLLPTVVSMVPKIAVAYVGTYVVGEMARYFYQHGVKPTPELVRQMSDDGLRLLRETAGRFGKRD